MTAAAAIARALPRPYYEEAGIAIYNCNCADILPLLEPGK